MSMNFLNKDQLCFYMIQGHLHLSKKDYNFFNNLVYQFKDKKPITTNQNKLFDKLLLKYKRQFTKLGINLESLYRLEWNVLVIESRQEYLTAKISIEDNNIIIRCPFNNRFIQEFRKATHTFEWNKSQKYYIGNFTTQNFKIAYTLLTKIYSSTTFCKTSQNLIDEIDSFKEIKYWSPTLVKVKNYFLIYAINESINQAIENIVLNDDPKTLFLLSKYGINIDKSITQNDKQKEFASNYKSVIDIENLKDLPNLLKLLDVSHVFTLREGIYNKSINSEIRKILSDNQISFSILSNSDKNGVLLYSHSVMSLHDKKRIDKIIKLTNSRPVEVK